MSPLQPSARPDWLSPDLYPFTGQRMRIEGSSVHYLDEGSGPPLLLLHGNPTWSFLYRDLVLGLRGRYRCIAPDFPGFGLSRAVPGYTFTPLEHAVVLERLILNLDLRGITMMVQDWGGPIGFDVAVRHPDRFRGFVVGNTWAWPRADLRTQCFSRFFGGPAGRFLIQRRNFFVETILPGNVKRTKLSPGVMAAYRGPFPDPESRRPMSVFPREILGSREHLAEVESGLPRLRDHPALIIWPTRDPAFRRHERERWEDIFPRHETVILQGSGHYIQEDAAAEIRAAIRGWQGV